MRLPGRRQRIYLDRPGKNDVHNVGGQSRAGICSSPERLCVSSHFLWHLNILHLGSAGVSIFFVLSGFLLTLRYKEDYPQSRIRDSLKFTYDHIKKLYLLYVITSIACLPFLIPKMHGDWLRILKRILVNLLLIQTWFTKIDIRYALNNPSWYLSAMVFIYALSAYSKRHTLLPNAQQSGFPDAWYCADSAFVQLGDTPAAVVRKNRFFYHESTDL